VIVPLPAAVAAHLALLHSGRLDLVLFVTAVVAFALGAILVLGSEGGSDGEGRPDDPEPHWWPDFEREFRVYVETRQRGRRRRLVRS
jgi:hypothetical protein